jgi:hypothetical protein
VKRDPWVLVGLAIVGGVAIAASFSTLISLAVWVGWHGKTAWMFPVCLDVLAIVSGRVWLSDFADAHARRYARGVSVAALVASVVGNAVGHIVSMHNASVIRVVLAIIVGSIPPIALGAVGHLATLATLQQPEPVVVQDIVAESIEPEPEPVVVETAPVEPEPEPVHVVDDSPKRRGRPAVKEPHARACWDAARAEGRMPSGAELARAAGADDKMGRTWRKRWIAEEQAKQAQNNNSGATLALVTT